MISGRQQGHDRDRLELPQQSVETGQSPVRNRDVPDYLGDQHRHDDVKSNRKGERFPRDDDCRKAEQEADDRRECKDHYDVVESDLAQREVRLTVRQVAPDEDHGGAWSSAKKDQPRDVAVHLCFRKQWTKQPANEKPA